MVTARGARCEEALVDAIRAHGRGLLLLAYRVVRDPDAAEEVVAEAYFRAWRARGRLRDENLPAWLRRTVFRSAIDLRQAEARRATLPLDEAVDVASPARGPEATAIWNEERRMVRAVLARIPSPFREAVRMREIEGWKVAPAAAALGVSTRMLKYYVARGRGIFAALFSGSLDTGGLA